MRRSIGLLVLLGATTACMHKQGGPITAWERINVSMAALGEVNTQMAKGIIAVQKSGAVTVQQAEPILGFQELVAKDHSAIENILLAGAAPARNHAAEIEALLSEIKAQGTMLIQSGTLQITNPQSQQAFTHDLEAIVNLANTVLAEYELARGE